MKSLPDLPYERAPHGSEDKYRLTRYVTFRWRNPPKWTRRALAGKPVLCPEGLLRLSSDPEGAPVLLLSVFAGFCFAVSVAPNFARALAAACLHDFLYKYAALIAAVCGLKVRSVLHIADHWFLAQMRASGFLLKRSYFIGVRMCGYWFSRLTQTTKGET
jgi:hypothetical protein